MTPVEGAQITARWMLKHANLHAPENSAVLHTAVARSDRSGRFAIAPWGPKLRPAFTWLDGNDPEIVVAAPGRLSNVESGETLSFVEGRNSASSRRRSAWHERDIWVFRWPAESAN